MKMFKLPTKLSTGRFIFRSVLVYMISTFLYQPMYMYPLYMYMQSIIDKYRSYYRHVNCSINNI